MEITEIENLAGSLATAVAKADTIQTAEQATTVAKALAIIEMGIADELRLQLETWTLANGPVIIDESGDQAYGHWEKKTTTLGDQAGLFELLTANGKDINHYQRADLSVIKGLLTGDDLIEGIEQFVGTDISYVFGFKRNLKTKPRNSAKGSTLSGETSIPLAPAPMFRLGPQGVVNRARVVTYTPTMPPARVLVTK